MMCKLYIHTRIHTDTTHMYTLIHIYTHTHILTYIHTLTHSLIHIHTPNKHIHTYYLYP